MATLYSPKIVTDGLVLALDAANQDSYSGSGTVWTDLSGNGNNGTLTNGPTFSSINMGSIQFDGVNDFINIPGNATTSFQPSNSFTISVFVNPKGMGGTTLITDNVFVILGVGSAAGSYGMGLNYNAVNESYQFRIGCRSTDNDFSLAYTSSNITLNRVYFLCLSYQSNGLQNIFIDNSLVSSISTTSFTSKTLTSATTNGYNIFRNSAVWGGNGRYGIGDVYNAQIYNRALTAAEVLQNYNATKGRFGL